MNAAAHRASAWFSAVLLAAFALATISGTARAQDTKVPVVVELFTSQACSSCPPADQLLGKLAETDDVIAISLPVDYWDHLEWTDTLGRAEHSKRQHDYARKLGLPSVYTPQIVVNGTKDVVGSRAEAVEAAIGTAQREGFRVPVEISLRGSKFEIRIGGSDDFAGRKARILAVPLLSAETVAIERGENRGKTITYHNVSRALKSIGTWNGEAQTLTLSHDAVMTADADRCAVILQDENTGAILGAALLGDT